MWIILNHVPNTKHKNQKRENDLKATQKPYKYCDNKKQVLFVCLCEFF